MSSRNIWLPQADAAQSSPAEFDHNKDVWAGEIQASRKAATFLPRLVKNAAPMFYMDGTWNKEVDFLVTGKMGTEKFQKGDTITGTQRNSIRRRITIDDRPNVTAINDEHITRRFEQIEFRSGVFDNMGFALAAHAEVELMKQIALTARTAAVGSESTTEFLRGGNFMFAGGETLVANASGTNAGYTADFGFNASTITTYTPGQANALALAKALKTISVGWAKRSVSPMGRYCVIPTELYYDFRELETVFPTQTQKIAGGIYGNLDIAAPTLPVQTMLGGLQPLNYMGFTILPHIFFDASFVDEINPFRADRAADPDRAGNFTSTVGLVFQSDACGWADVMQTGINVERPPLSAEETAWAMSWHGGGPLDPVNAVELIQS